MKAILWHDEPMGAEYEVEDIPADLEAEAEEWREKLLEGAANYDDALMEKYLEDPSSITEEELIAAIRKGCVAMECCPVDLGFQYKNKGVQPLLDYVCAFLPSPVDTPNIIGTNPDTEEEEDRKPDENEPTSPSHSRLPLTRSWAVLWCTSASIRVRWLQVLTSTTPFGQSVSASVVLFQMNSHQEIPMETSTPAISRRCRFKDIRTVTRSCDEAHPIVLESMTFPTPSFLSPWSRRARPTLPSSNNGLAKLAEEDPTFTVRTDEQSGHDHHSGMGELHLDIIIDRLKRDFIGLECNQGKPQVNYNGSHHQDR
jgi:elongation factor G